MSGIILGSLAGLNSLGLVLLWRSTRVVNLAQPAMGLVGGVLTGLLIVVAHWNFWLAALAGLVVGTLLGFATEHTIMRRFQDAPQSTLLLGTVGLAALFGGLQTGLPFIFTGRSLPTYSVDLGMSFDIGVEHVTGPKVLALVAFPLCLALMLWFTRRTRLGLQALALGQNRERAKSLGVRAVHVRAIVWAIAGMLATISGILSIPIQGFNLAGGLGPAVLVLALAPAVIAGFRSMGNAALASVVIGVGYSLLHFYVSRSFISELTFGVALLIALAVRRRVIARGEPEAQPFTSLGAARPLPWPVTSRARFKAVASMGIALALAAGAIAPSLLSPDHRVLFATSAALAIGSLSVGAVWMFTGEIALGNWGLAGFGALIAAFMPGPWYLRALVSAVAIGCAGALLGLAARTRSTLSYAVAGLIVAASAPVALSFVGDRTIQAPVVSLGAVAAVVAVLAAIALTRLRNSLAGYRMIAARDEPRRAAQFGARPLRARALAFGISGALAGFAGALYLAATSSSLAVEAFHPARSLDILAMAVIGGLSSPTGALVGAGIVQLSRFALPQPWSSVTAGIGVLMVLLLRPEGLMGLIEKARDALAGGHDAHSDSAVTG